MSGMISGETPYLSPRRGGGGALEYSQVFVRIEAPEPDRVRILIRQACLGGPVEKRPAVAFEVSIDPDVGTLRLEEHPVRCQDREEGTTPWRGAGDREDAAVSAAARQESLLMEPLPLPLQDREEADREFPEVHSFGEFMLRRLVQHRHKGAQTDWQQDPIAGLLRGAVRELSELEQVHGVLGVRDPDRIALMAADVANYALLVADACYEQAAGVGLAGIAQEQNR